MFGRPDKTAGRQVVPDSTPMALLAICTGADPAAPCSTASSDSPLPLTALLPQMAVALLRPGLVTAAQSVHCNGMLVLCTKCATSVQALNRTAAESAAVAKQSPRWSRHWRSTLAAAQAATAMRQATDSGEAPGMVMAPRIVQLLD